MAHRSDGVHCTHAVNDDDDDDINVRDYRTRSSSRSSTRSCASNKLGKICVVYGRGDLSIENSELCNNGGEYSQRGERATFSLPLIVHPADGEI